jgi:lipopolysaccharide/colanic/teichoic acid biosynthesis glycosyltransferase
MPQSRRKAETALAAGLLLVSSPIWLLIAIGIRLSDRGPVFYVADRAGLHGCTFRMCKFRTMRIHSDGGSRIAAANDPRVFPFGALLRKLKLDELPQLLNIVRGDMAFVGPRPEDPWIVENFYTAEDRETLEVLPGLTSPGTLHYFTQVEQALDEVDTERAYILGPLKTKLDMDRTYFARSTASSDLRIIFETAAVLLRIAVNGR